MQELAVLALIATLVALSLSGCQVDGPTEPTKPTEPTSHCKPLAVQAPRVQAINVVFVPSAFHHNMQLWRQEANKLPNDFSRYAPLDAANVFGLNIWYVDQQGSFDDGNQCYFGNGGIARLLGCHNPEHFKRHATQHCGAGIPMAVVIVHNSQNYGGAGGNPAIISTHPSSSQVAVHELGHSMFGLGDEYNHPSGDPKHDPNCDWAGCSKWSDLLGKWGVTCKPQSCDGGSYYASGDTTMLQFSLPFGAVNERITCCKYVYHTGSTPGYCHKFNTQGLNLKAFCDSNIWRGRYGNIQGLLAQDNTSSDADPVDVMKRIARDPQGQEYVYVEHPVEWMVERQNSLWTCIRMPTELKSGLYPKETFLGNPSVYGFESKKELGSDDSQSNNIVLQIFTVGSENVREVNLATARVIEVPPDASGNFDNVSDFVEQRTLLSIILSDGESCRWKPFE